MLTCVEEVESSGRSALTPIANLLAHRGIALAVVLSSLAHVLLVGLELPGWSCPIRAATGLPCPGCGLGRAAVELLRGHWLAAVHTHPFAPLLVLVLLLMCAALLSPAGAHRRLVSSVAFFERTTYVSLVALSSLVLFWLWRLANSLG